MHVSLSHNLCSHNTGSQRYILYMPAVITNQITHCTSSYSFPLPLVPLLSFPFFSRNHNHHRTHHLPLFLSLVTLTFMQMAGILFLVTVSAGSSRDFH